MKLLSSSPRWLGLAWKVTGVAAIVLALVVGFSQWGAGVSATDAVNHVIVGQTNGGGAYDVNEYNAASITITAGTTVTWDSAPDDRRHDVTSVVIPGGEAAFGSGDMRSSGLNTFSWTLNTAGTYTYYCTFHATASQASLANIDANIAAGDIMVGKIVVEAAPIDSVGPITSVVAASPDPTDGAASVTLTATVDDSTTGNSNIQAAEYFIDTAGAAGTGTPMSATDGSFDSDTENVTAIVDVSGLDPGTYTLFVRGQDVGDTGTWGATNSVGFEVTPMPSGSELATVTISGGTLSLTTNSIDFGSIALSGLDQIVGTQPTAWRATDARGSGAGWNVTLTSTNFTTAGGTITVDNFKMKLDDAYVGTVSGNTPPTSQATSYQPLHSSTPLKLLSAAVTAGMGTYDFTPDAQLTVPAESAPGDYEAFMTVSINSGP